MGCEKCFVLIRRNKKIDIKYLSAISVKVDDSFFLKHNG